MANGIVITQEGIDISQASDYQKVLDSRWLFIEIGLEVNTTMTLPALATATTSGYQRVNIARHNLTRKGNGFVPAFHGSYKIRESYPAANFTGKLACDDQWLYFYRSYITGDTPPAYTIDIVASIYDLPILEEYLAIAEIEPVSAKSDSRFGVRALDGSDSAVGIDDVSSHGFSIDTRKKILSVHKVTTKKVNYYANNAAKVTAIDTATDILTIDTSPSSTINPDGINTGLTWIDTGKKLQYTPADFVTWPTPLSSSISPYVIKVSQNQIKLALTATDAAAGIAINLTAAGSLPATIRDLGSDDDSRVPHENNYPPSYMFCNVLPNNINGAGQAVNSLYHISSTPIVRADSRYLYFTGVQTVYTAKIAVIILKDPIEVAQ